MDYTMEFLRWNFHVTGAQSLEKPTRDTSLTALKIPRRQKIHRHHELHFSMLGFTTTARAISNAMGVASSPPQTPPTTRGDIELLAHLQSNWPSTSAARQSTNLTAPIFLHPPTL